MTPRQIKMLDKLAPRVLATCELDDAELRTVQDLVKRGFARDYADFYRKRTPLHLRLWGITPAGQAILHSHKLTSKHTRRPELSLGPVVVPLFDNPKNIQVRIRSPQPPEGFKLIPSYRSKPPKDKDKQP